VTDSTSPATHDLKVAVAHTFELIQQRRPEVAEQQAREILRVYPGEVNALRALGQAQRLLKKYEDAATSLEAAVAAAPGFALARQDLGLVYAATGRTDEAIATLRAGLERDETLSRSWQALGELYLASDDSDAANNAFRQQLRHSTRDQELVRAVELLESGKVGEAERVCRDYLKRCPTDVSAIRLLADIGLRLKIFGDAEKLLQRALELAPDYHLARLNYASALSGRQKPSQALEQLNILERAEPDKPSHLVLKASVLAQMGDYPQAITCYEKLLTQFRPQARISLSYGHALKTVGRLPEAIAAYRRAIALDPGLGDAYWSLANLKTYRFEAADLAAMEAQISSGKAGREDYFHLCFALGKALEDAGQCERSFKFYDLGNQVKKRQEGYRAEANQEDCQRVIATCDVALFARNAGVGCLAADPIFIVGLPRSGSTLLEQILASHSQVDGTKELPDIIAIARRLGDRIKKSDRSRYPEILGTLNLQQCQELGEEYLQRARVQRGAAPFFIDKMPNNFAHIGLIQLILPRAKIIDARRHPMAACFSGYKQLFASGQRFSYSLRDIGEYYRDYVALMDHWDKALPGKVLRVEYEDVVADTEPQVRRILDYCALPFEDSCLNFHQTERAVRTASSEQVRQPIYQSGLQQWRHFEPWLGELKTALGPVLDRFPDY
jgi:tetratricopeptide (TPR) repeat protein